MKIAILGTRGIPNYYGGFEQFAQYLSDGLVKRGHDVSVYTPHNHSHKASVWNAVKIIHKYDPEFLIGTAGQFLYDLNCIIDSRHRSFDVILQLGYTSSSVWSSFFPKSACIITNMDGLEWKRTKYNRITQRFLKLAERMAVKQSDELVADSIGIQKYITNTYGKMSTFIPYGANVFNSPDSSVLGQYNLTPFQYDMLIARLEPENSIDTILQGVKESSARRPFLVVGNHETKFGAFLKKKYGSVENIRFFGPQYDIAIINNLRFFSNLYFHGHTVGGTNPSLLEAMASQALIAAHDNEFNSSILGNDAYYFRTADDVRELLDCKTKQDDKDAEGKILRNLKKIEAEYSWHVIVDQYERLFETTYAKREANL